MIRHADVPVQFGTSSLRGSAKFLTADFVDGHIRAFLLEVCGFLETPTSNAGRRVFIAMDRRESSPRIAAHVLRSVERLGGTAVFFGYIPTPALAAYGFQHEVPSIMITASHNPAPHNGIKFYTATGELLHNEQARMLARMEMPEDGSADAQAADLPAPDPAARKAYIDRYVTAFDGRPLRGLHLALDLHSAAGKDLMAPILEGLGATCTIIRDTDDFIAIDTENVPPETLKLYRDNAASGQFDAVVSTDGDGDRPLLTDETGRQIHGDQLGILAAKNLDADTIVTPVSTTTALELSGWFARIERTKIGSPYIIKALAPFLGSEACAMAFEANGGFVLASDAVLPGCQISALPTRDAMLPMLAVLIEAACKKQKLSELKATLPARFVAAGSMIGVPTEQSHKLIQSLSTDTDARIAFADDIAPLADMNLLDGLRLQGENGQIIHLRPSGNAPELRIYVETEADETSRQLLEQTRQKLTSLLV